MTASSLSSCCLSKSSDRRRRSRSLSSSPLRYFNPCPNLSSPYELPTSVSVMVALDDYRRSDAVPPLTLWQMIQISPFILFLRKYSSCRLHSVCPDMENPTLLLQLSPSYLAYSAKIRVAHGAARRALLQRDTSSACVCGQPGSSSPWSASRRLRRMRRGRARMAQRSSRTSFPRAQSCTGSGHEEWTG